MTTTDVAIIGGSAAGLMAAVTVKKRHPDKKVAVIEKEIKEIKKALNVNITVESKILESRVSVLERKLDTLLAR